LSDLTPLGIADLPGAVVVYDPEGRITDANPAACALLGVDRARLVGAAATSVHPALQATDHRRPQKVARIERPGRSDAWVLADVLPKLDPSAAVRHVVASLTDVTALVGETTSSTADTLGALGDLTQQMTNARLGPEAILSAVISSLSRVRPGTWVASLLNKDPRTVRVVAANDSQPLLARYVEDMHQSGEAAASTIASQVIENGCPVLMPSVSLTAFMEMLRADVRSYMARHSLPVPSGAEEVSVLVVPMRARGGTIGTLGVFAARPATPFAQEDVAWLQAIADRTGLATENAQLYADAVQRRERLTGLGNIGLAIAGSPDLRLTLQVILDQVTAGLEVDAADLLVLDEDGATLVMAAQTGFQSTAMPDYRLAVDDQLPGRIITKPRVETVVGGSRFSQFKRRTLFAREGFRAYCAAPLVARNRTGGVLEVFKRSALQPDDEWLSFLEALASLAAVAVDSAHMFERLQRPAQGGRTTASPPRLSALEKQVLSLLVEGTTNSAIAEAVHLSQSTVKFHVRQILQKVGAGNRTELARVATREGWL